MWKDNFLYKNDRREEINMVKCSYHIKALSIRKEHNYGK